jgi:hypothetical protein
MNRWLSLGIAVVYVLASAMSAQAADLPGRLNFPVGHKAVGASLRGIALDDEIASLCIAPPEMT